MDSLDKICRICLEEGALSNVFSKNFAITLSEMIEACSSIRIKVGDGLPEKICSNCVYKLGIAYHLKQTCNSSDSRLRRYLGLSIEPRAKDATVMADLTNHPPPYTATTNPKCKCVGVTRSEKRSRYQRKAEGDKLKRGPKPRPHAPHTCYTCDKEFRCQAQLDIHLRTHTGERPFACAYCPQRFAQKHNLAIHVRTHTGEKPFQCEICSKRFTAQGNLQAHLKIHLGQRDQVCVVCGKGFYTSSEVTRHMRRHRRARDHKCDLCTAAYAHLRDLKRHKQKQHNVEPEKAPRVPPAPPAPAPAPPPAHHFHHKIENMMENPHAHAHAHKAPQLPNYSCSTCGDHFDFLSMLTHHTALRHSYEAPLAPLPPLASLGPLVPGPAAAPALTPAPVTTPLNY